MQRGQLRRAAWAAALLLAVLLQAVWPASAAAASRRTNCGGGRRLRQESGRSTPSPVDGNGTIETVEVDVVSQECSMSQNVYFEAGTPDVRVITEPDVNLQPTARSCCASCHDIPACSAFQWCPLEEGCAVPGASSVNISFPYQGCQLLDLNAFLRTSVNTGEIKVSGPKVPFTTGIPLFFSVPKLTGYDVEVGRNMGGKFNYTCAATMFPGSCVMIGTAQELGAACDNDPMCLAFSFWPKGAAWDGNQSYGVLKGGQGVQLSSGDTELNPNAAIYFKLQPMGQGGGGEEIGGAATPVDDGDGDGTSTGTIIAAVVGSVAGVALIAGVLLGFVWVRYRRLKAAAVSDVRKAAPGGRTSGEGGLTPAGSGPLADGSSGGETPVAVAAGAAPGSGQGGLPSAPPSHQDRLPSAPPSHQGGSAATSSPAKSAPLSGSQPLGPEVELAGGAFLVAAAVGGPAGQPQWQQQQGGSSLFVGLSPDQLGAAVDEELEVVDVSHSGSSEGSPWRRGAAPQSSPWQLVAAPVPAAGGALAAVAQPAAQPSGGTASGSSNVASGSSAGVPLVVEVQRAASGVSGGGRGDLPASLQKAATARELLDVFAQMYSQRPAVDYAVVAQMLDQDADPHAVEVAEAADAAALQQVDAAALQARSASRSRSPPSTAAGTASLGASLARSETAAQREATIATLVAAAEAHQPAAAAAAAQAAAGAAGGAPGPAPLPGSAALQQEQSLLPGMFNAEPSLEPVRPSEWSLQPEEVEICKRPDGSFWQLGTGAFGTCYKGLYHGQQLVAVKVLHRVEERRRGEEFEREVALLKTLRDRNIVQFIGACLEGPTPMLVTEFMEFGDLWRALPLKNAADQRIFAWAKRGRRVLFDVAKGLYYLHQRRIVHLDLKSANILLSRHGTAKICDIGMARVLGNKEYLSMLSGMGTFAWSAPEVLSGKRCTEKVDLYSYGVVIWEVCTGDVPVRGEMRPLVAPQDCPQEVVDLYNRCVSERPEERPTAAELLTTLAPLL